MEQEQTTTAIQIPRELLERTKQFAATQDRSMAYVIRKAIQEYLDKQEQLSKKLTRGAS